MNTRAAEEGILRKEKGVERRHASDEEYRGLANSPERKYNRRPPPVGFRRSNRDARLREYKLQRANYSYDASYDTGEYGGPSKYMYRYNRSSDPRCRHRDTHTNSDAYYEHRWWNKERRSEEDEHSRRAREYRHRRSRSIDSLRLDVGNRRIKSPQRPTSAERKPQRVWGALYRQKDFVQLDSNGTPIEKNRDVFHKDIRTFNKELDPSKNYDEQTEDAKRCLEERLYDKWET